MGRLFGPRAMSSVELHADKLCRLDALQTETHVIFCLHLSSKENRFNPDFCTSLNTALDSIQSHLGGLDESVNVALLTCGNGRFFSNGLDLQFLLTQKEPNGFLAHTYRPLMARFLSLNMPSIAFVNGHAFAAGMVLALAHDYRLTVSESRALWSMNELLIKASIPAGMLGILRAKIPSPLLLRDCIMARRWTSDQAIQYHMADSALPENSLEMAIEFAKSKAMPAKLASVLHSIKSDTYQDALSLLTDPGSDAKDPFRFAMRQGKL